ncbi:MAG: LacI family DNA-binding transcriptional regulator [Verrucomicrobiota bacterium]|nr:LacI family DNA-binding transcriptional regulator [Verrucomicrobiota bacterium]
MRPTQRDIAERLGISQATVSLALQKSPKINAETIQRVLDAAEAIHYQPDPALLNMSAYRWPEERKPLEHRIAFIYFKSALELQAFPAAREHAAKMGYQLDCFEIPLEHNLHLLRMLYHRGYEGVVVGNIQDPYAPLMTNQDYALLPCVACGHGVYVPPIHRVAMDWFSAVRLAWGKLRSLGYRRIGAILFTHSPPVPDDAFRHGALLYEQSLLRVPEEIIPPLLDISISDNDAHKIYLPWMQEHRPDAVLAFHEGVLWYLQEYAKYRIPEELGVALLQRDTNYNASGIEFHGEILGRAAIDLLDSNIRHNRKGLVANPTIKTVIPDWIDGDTTRLRAIVSHSDGTNLKPSEEVVSNLRTPFPPKSQAR